MMRVYRHVIEELDHAPRVSAEDAVRAAGRGADVRSSPRCRWVVRRVPNAKALQMGHGANRDRTGDLLLAKRDA